MHMFEFVAGSVIGRNHRESGKNNHDSHCVIQEEQALIALVCVGCGASPHSEVGAKLGSHVIAQSLAERLRPWHKAGRSISDHQFEKVMEQVRLDTVTVIRLLARMMGGAFTETINDFFLFTVAGTVLMPKHTYVFSIGDCVFAVNGTIETVGPFPDNEPPYLAYALVDQFLGETNQHAFKFRIAGPYSTSTINSILIGTDGATDLIAAAGRCIPGREEIVGPLDQFWQSDSYFLNADKLRRTLTLINRDVVRLTRDRVVRDNGLLQDDTTLIVIRRKPDSQGGA